MRVLLWNVQWPLFTRVMATCLRSPVIFIPFPGQDEVTYVSRFEQYDDKVNTDAFWLIHDTNDHLFLLPGVQLQKNNPRKLIRTGGGNDYTIDYTYTYNDRNAPLTKTGDAIFTSGPNAGQRWQANAAYNYYP